MSDYWNIDAALVEEAVIPSKLKYGIDGLGKILDPSIGKYDLPANEKVDVPFWLSAALVKRDLATLTLPSFYSEKNRRRINAGAECPNFRANAPNFYDVGNKCNEFLQQLDLSTFLSRTFTTRYQELISRGLQGIANDDLLKLQSKLSHEETKLFEAGCQSVTDAERWSRGAKRDSLSSMQSSLSRKRAAEMGLGDGAGSRPRIV
mmetsp:Transcript_11900/g.21355  ORF Transcript_11900/g.21355 Transcript_11900/m.21355 type:complete len:205 (-) Transcript_11900:326-940(-)